MPKIRLAWLRPSTLWLVGSTLWISLFPVVFGLLVEKRGYAPEMLGAGLVMAGLLAALGEVWPPLAPLGVFLTGLALGTYAFLAHYWGVGALEIRLLTVLDSPTREQSDFIRTYVVRSKFFWFLLGYLMVGMVGSGIYLWQRKPNSYPAKARFTAFGFAVIMVTGLALFWDTMHTYPLLRLGEAVHTIYRDYRVIFARRGRVREVLAAMPQRACADRFEKIVFIMGESANRDFLHLYGFDLPTSPFLDGLEPKVVLRAISPANQTLTTIPPILTPATVTEYDRFYHEPSVLSHLRRCGYQVFWLSNQLRYSPYTSTVSSIADEADVVRFTYRDLGEDYAGKPDEILLNLLQPSDIVPGKKQAFFFHFLGSHFDWKDRYPPEKALIPNPKSDVDHYINSIAYTDYVLSRIFQTFRQTGDRMLFVYTSDHGEYVTEEEIGHAFATSYQEEYRVPLVFWATDPEVLAPLAQTAGHRLVNTETLDQTLLYLIGLQDDPGLSFRTLVLSLGPPRVRDYTQLPNVTYQETP